jgi:hypothetical protein
MVFLVPVKLADFLPLTLLFGSLSLFHSIKQNGIYMKHLLLITVFIIIASQALYAQSSQEAEIRRLEQLEITSIQKGDTTALLKLWGKELVVNNPYGQIVTLPQILGFIRTGQIDYATVERKVENVSFIENLAVSMGKEIVTPEKNTNYAGKVVTRQYTNIWMKKENGWRMIARQATILSKE